MYLPTLRYGFVWDDEHLVTKNARLETANPLQFFGQDFMPSRHGSDATRIQYYRPLTVLSLWLDRQVWGLNPSGFHLTNVLLNALVLVLLGLLLCMLSGRSWPGLVGLALFGLHPAHVESVAFVSGRTDLLAAVFALSCFLCLVRYAGRGQSPAERTRPQSGTVPAGVWPVAAVMCCAAACLSKEVAVLLPLVGFVMLRHLGCSRRRAGIATAVLAAVVVGYILLRSAVLGSSALAVGSAGFSERLLLFLNAFGRYGRLAVFPFIHRLVYPDRAAFAAFGWPTVAGVCLLLLLCWFGWRARRSTLGLGAMWFLAFILPVANLFSIGDTFLAERLLYLPLAGLAVMALSVEQLRPTWRRTLIPLLAGYALLMAVDSLSRMLVWRDPVGLFRTMAAEAPNSSDAHLNLGAALLNQEKDTLAAEAEFRRALAIEPRNPVAHNNFGDILRKRGELAAARQEYADAVSLDPGYAEAHGNLGIVLLQTGQADSALAQLRQARMLSPNLAPVYVNIGNCFAALGWPDSAKSSFWKAIRLQPGLVPAYVNLSRLYAVLGKPDSAEVVSRLLQQRTGFGH